MKIGSHYRWWDVSLRDWIATAARLDIDGERATAPLRRLAFELPDIALEIVRQTRESGVDHAVFDRIVDGIARAARRMRLALDTATL